MSASYTERRYVTNFTNHRHPHRVTLLVKLVSLPLVHKLLQFHEKIAQCKVNVAICRRMQYVPMFIEQVRSDIDKHLTFDNTMVSFRQQSCNVASMTHCSSKIPRGNIEPITSSNFTKATMFIRGQAAKYRSSFT